MSNTESNTEKPIFKQSISLSENSEYISNDISTARSAFLTLPVVIQTALEQAKRVVLIANNPAVTTVQLEMLIQPDDVLVLFNHFIHADFFANHQLASSLPKLLFFRQIGDSKLHFGLPPRSNHISVMEQMSETAPLGVLTSNQPYQFPTLADDPSPNDDPITTHRILDIPSNMQKLWSSPTYHSVLSERHEVVADYPYFTDIHSSAPSSGFLLYRLMLAARAYLYSIRKTKLPLEVAMIGFNDNDKTAHFWHGHNWDFERQEMSRPPTEVTIHRY
ncbi:hypothetical protein ACS8FA_04490 [Psychrobacter sp. 1Y1]|uniref:hypothetical protein n=1 Tax=unclassified Psychrobacter TaxID=196806 RepID=UPI00070BFA62|nr:hypothetical protein [Psychrobacter sp. P11G3]KRG36738.1 hypothetical protein AK824_06415 [Psychrobacter sp. P11G3]